MYNTFTSQIKSIFEATDNLTAHVVSAGWGGGHKHQQPFFVLFLVTTSYPGLLTLHATLIPRFVYLSMCDYFLWEHLKAHMYVITHHTLDEPKEAIYKEITQSPTQCWRA